MRKIKRFKIPSRQREILRKLLRELPLLRRAGFTSEAEVTAFILALFKLLDPGVVYEFNQEAHWELDDQNVLYKEMFSACAVTLGNQLEPFLQNITNEDRKTVSMIVILEFLRSAVTFVADLVKEQAEKEECETLELQFVYIPPFGAAAAPKLLREAIRLENSLSQKALPVILKELNSDKIDLSISDGKELMPQISTVFLVPWQKSRKKGKK